jgi:hypothetical protein
MFSAAVNSKNVAARKKPMTMACRSNTLPRSNSQPSSVKTTPSGSPRSSPLAARKNSQHNLPGSSKEVSWFYLLLAISCVYLTEQSSKKQIQSAVSS